jgi:hypothetical protein
MSVRIAYKLIRERNDGTLAPLFINRTITVPLNKWLQAECIPTKGYAVRQGWHTTSEPKAPHLSEKGRVWVKVEIKDYEEFKRPKSQGGLWFIAQRMKVLGKI